MAKIVFEKVKLTLTEVEEARACGVARHQTHVTANNATRRLSADPHQSDILGAIGEFAFAKRTNGLFQVDQQLYVSGDGGYDFLARTVNGDLKIDVRMGQNPKHNLLVKMGMRKKPDVYVYGYVDLADLSDVTLCGYIRHGEAATFAGNGFVRGSLYSNHIVPPRKLHPLIELLDTLVV